MNRKLLLATLALAACSKKPVPLAPVPAPINSDSIARARADSIARADAERQAEIARAQAEQDSIRAARARDSVALGANTMNILTTPIYYDFDASSLTDAAQTLLRAKMPVMQSRPGLRIRIVGHTDDRGSSEYNLALGLRRASEAKAFLVSNGIDGGRIDIGSLGEEMPAVTGDNEDAWAKNRRAEFTTANGGSTP